MRTECRAEWEKAVVFRAQAHRNPERTCASAEIRAPSGRRRAQPRTKESHVQLHPRQTLLPMRCQLPWGFCMCAVRRRTFLISPSLTLRVILEREGTEPQPSTSAPHLSPPSPCPDGPPRSGHFHPPCPARREETRPDSPTSSTDDGTRHGAADSK